MEPIRRFSQRLCFIALLLTLLSAVSPASGQNSGQAEGGQTRVDALLASMPLERKVAQMFMVALYGPTLNVPGRDFLREWQPGGVVLFVSNAGTPGDVTTLTNSWQQTVVDAGGVPLFIATDQEGGVIARLKEGFTEWPAPMVLTASGSVELAYRVGDAMADELRAVGINMNLAPVADLYTNLRNPVIGRRSFGSDPQRTGQMLAALIRGMQAGGVLATAKHFPGHGDTSTDSHTSLPVVNHTREELTDIELAPFRWTVAAGVETMMTAHIWFPALDPAGEMPASLSPNVITGLLRSEMAFRGLIMTDALEMDAIDTRYSYSEAAIMAIQAGNDMIAFGAHLTPNVQAEAMQAVVDAVRTGTLTEARIDDSVRRILSAKARYGVLDWQTLDADSASTRIDLAAHAALVEEVFRAGVTIAYDDSDLLPVPDDKRVTLIYPGTRPGIRRACEPLHAAINWVGLSANPLADEIRTAVTAAAQAETVIVFTENANTSPEQQALVNALPQNRTVAVALFSPYEWQAFPEVAAYVTTYSPLEPGVRAACGVVFGDIPTTAQLPVSLDGARIFSAGAVVAFAPTVTAFPSPTLAPSVTGLPSPTVTPWLLPITSTVTPWLLPVSPTHTRAPLLSSTRESGLPPVPAVSATVQPTESPQSTAAPQSSVTPVPTRVAMLNLTTATGSAESATITPVSSAEMMAAVPFALAVTIGVVGSGLVYGGLLMQGAKRTRRFQNGFILERCPVCGDAGLNVEQRSKRTLGISHSVRHAVRCTACHSILREVSTDRWRLRVNPDQNRAFFTKYHNKIVSSENLHRLRWKDKP